MSMKWKLSLLGLLVSAAVTVSAQTTRVTLSLRDAALSELIVEIERQTDHTFLYNNTIDLTRLLSVEAVDEPLEGVLKRTLATAGIGFELTGMQIVLTRRAATSGLPSYVTVSGTVTDGSGPIAGAGVTVDGTTIGVTTDINGNYSLEVPPGSAISVSFLGYVTERATVGGRSRIDFLLHEETREIEDVVVIGYGAVKKRDLTGAVSSIKADEIRSASGSNFGQMLSGKAAGMLVTQNSGQPGGQVDFQIRGATSVNASNEPLFIIDGFPVSNYSETRVDGVYDPGNRSPLNTINPADIESIEILKDASATAIYGARAANGVIIITTKKGKEGQARLEYSGSYSIQTPAKNYKMLNAADHRRVRSVHHREDWLQRNQIGIYGGRTEAEINAGGQYYVPIFTQSEIDNPPHSTDWIDLIMRGSGSIQQHNVSVSGGTRDMRYLMSGNVFDQKGLIKNERFRRYSLRANLEQDLWKIVKVGLNSTMSRIDSDNTTLGTRNANQNHMGVLNTAMAFGPDLPVYDDNGDYYIDPLNSLVPNPVSLLDIQNKSVVERILVVAYIEVQPVAGLTLRASGGLDRNISKNSQYLPKTTNEGKQSNGDASISQSDGFDLNFDLTATYTRSFNADHSLTVMAGTSYQSFDQRSVSAGNKDFITDAFGYNNLSAGAYERPSAGSYGEKSAMGSYFGRVNYSLLDRYLFTFTIRSDGASNFAENKKWATFPSGAVAWRISDEAFMRSTRNYLSNLKLRISYGQTGNSSIGYMAFANYAADRLVYFGNTPNTAVYARQLTNPNLTWETTTELNLGLDFGFLNERLSGSLEYFTKKTTDLLDQRDLLSYHEITRVAYNIGSTKGTGVELTLKSVNVNNSRFHWATTFTFSRYRDRWHERDPQWKPAIYESRRDYIRHIFVYESDGLVQPGEVIPHMPNAIPGQVKIKDRNGYAKDADGNFLTDDKGRFIYTGEPDGVINEADMISLGMDGPGFTMGLGNTFTYKGFDLNVYFYGMFNRRAYNYMMQYFGGYGYGLLTGCNVLDIMKNAWRPDNQQSTIPSLFQSNSSLGYGDYLYEPGWFVRCKNITLGYTIPSRVLRNKGSIRAYVDIQNPFIITRYSGLDPETDGLIGAYPNVRSFSFGIDLRF